MLRGRWCCLVGAAPVGGADITYGAKREEGVGLASVRSGQSEDARFLGPVNWLAALRPDYLAAAKPTGERRCALFLQR